MDKRYDGGGWELLLSTLRVRLAEGCGRMKVIVEAIEAELERRDPNWRGVVVSA